MQVSVDYPQASREDDANTSTRCLVDMQPWLLTHTQNNGFASPAGYCCIAAE
jgi:hypothetical protein